MINISYLRSHTNKLKVIDNDYARSGIIPQELAKIVIDNKSILQKCKGEIKKSSPDDFKFEWLFNDKRWIFRGCCEVVFKCILMEIKTSIFNKNYTNASLQCVDVLKVIRSLKNICFIEDFWVIMLYMQQTIKIIRENFVGFTYQNRLLLTTEFVSIFDNMINDSVFIKRNASYYDLFKINRIDLIKEEESSYLNQNSIKVASEIKDFYARLIKEESNEFGKKGEVDSKIILDVYNVNFFVIVFELALVNFKTDHGTFPLKLCDLSPYYIRHFPINQFPGYFFNYNYINKNKCCVNWTGSVGMNLRATIGSNIQFINDKAVLESGRLQHDGSYETG